jgi:hypothetical protein
MGIDDSTNQENDGANVVRFSAYTWNKMAVTKEANSSSGNKKQYEAV